jgi:hypothetical protein
MELERLRTFLSGVVSDVDYSFSERVMIWIARLLRTPDEGGPGLAPAFGLRGDADKLLFYQAGDAHLTLEIQDDPESPGRKSVLGLVLGIDPSKLEARLWQNEQPFATTPVDELGNFVFSSLEPGHFELIISGPRIEIHVQDLAVR